MDNLQTKNLNTCRVCGFIYEDFFPWGEDGNSPSEVSCDCCNVEFGYGDNNFKAIQNWRNQWINSGAKWHNESKRPLNWSFEEQLKNIPEEFK